MSKKLVDINGLTTVEDGITNGVKKGEVIGFVLGIILFATTMYAMHLSVKANRLAIRKLKDEGYQ